MSLDYSAGYPDNRDIGRNVVNDDGTRPDDAVRTDRDFVADCRARADVGAVANSHVPANGDPRIEVHKVPDGTIVRHRNLHVENAVAADARSTRHDRARRQTGPGTDLHLRTD